MKASELISSGGKVSHNKVWSNIAYGLASMAFVYEVLHDQDTEWLWLIYLGVVGGSQLVDKMLTLRYGGKVNASVPDGN